MDLPFSLKKKLVAVFFILVIVDEAQALASVSQGQSSASSTATSFFSSHTKNRASPKKSTVVLTYLEINGWLLSTGGLTLLIDPILEGNLDFGIPSLYQGKKRVLPSTGLAESLPPIDCLLITQGLDDHAHVRTLKKLHQLQPNLPILAPPSAKRALEESGFYNPQANNPLSTQIRFLGHQEEAVIQPRGDTTTSAASSSVRVRATKGALVGPPWQRRENGYIVQASSSESSSSTSTLFPSIYIEPHVEFNKKELAKLGPVDVMISPVSGQALPAFELVHGPKETMRLVETLLPKYLVPLQNGDVDTEGPVSRFVSEVGSPSEFARRLSASNVVNTELVKVVPGEDIELSL